MTEIRKTISELHTAYQDEIKGLHKTHQVEVKRLHGLHSVETKRKDSFCKAEKVQVLSKLQASYNKKLLSLYRDQLELGY